jgi:aminopeptidase N
MVAATRMEPRYTHEVFPCFNEPQFTATFDISVAALPKQTVLANTPLKDKAEPEWVPLAF